MHLNDKKWNIVIEFISSRENYLNYLLFLKKKLIEKTW